MKFVDLIALLEGIAASQPSVRTIVRQDVARLNAVADAKYGVFSWVQETHRADPLGDMVAYSFVLFYVDRLTTDKHNLEEVQGTGYATLTNIVRSLIDAGLDCGDMTLTPFAHRFADDCGGAWCRVVITAPVDLCAEDFDSKQVTII